jgi:hypothetical protein
MLVDPEQVADVSGADPEGSQTACQVHAQLVDAGSQIPVLGGRDVGSLDRFLEVGRELRGQQDVGARLVDQFAQESLGERE